MLDQEIPVFTSPIDTVEKEREGDDTDDESEGEGRSAHEGEEGIT